MMLKTCIFITAVAFQAFASPLKPVEPPRDLNAEDWSLLNFQRVCTEDQNHCDYSFLISEYTTEVPKHCSFTVKAADGRPAYQTGFSLAKCPASAEYDVNGGWNDHGFITLTVINNKKSLVPFFAYKDDVLFEGAEAAPQQSKVYLHPIPIKRGVSMRDPHKVLEDAAEWKLVDVARYIVNQGTPTEAIVISFSIQAGDASSEYCFLEIPVAQGETYSKSFYGRECQQGAAGWTISWGHDESTDEAVMTVVNRDRRKHAYFGFNNVSTHVLLGVNGPSPTKPLS
ncbi:uncharacterized protein CTRU02_201863 [Colletotrichum truncatum]|uniref:Uncharacterized protein n=1 Tax=Colletotrichum truncatum TaxID=5467 RepID=A0ACC3ZIK7_COLTU|nr:uncharacterized protein CTRU02_06976 [Colletotrichum truncatum]KAF6791792.1 hypothetical protein CTRU02_06976 [Colletotrichum truncatum]